MSKKVSNDGMSIKEWIDYHQGKHFCHCGCNEEITIKVHHRYYGIPDYILNHYQKTDESRDANSERVIQLYKDRPELKKQISLSVQGVKEGLTNQEWVDNENAKKIHYCKCGCGELIDIQPCHRNQGIPEYIYMHYQKSEEGLIDNSKRAIEYYKNHPEAGIEHGKCISQLYKDKPEIIRQISLSVQGVEEGLTNKEWADNENAKKIHYCKCGCNELIDVQPYHRSVGIPEYITHHYINTDNGKMIISATLQGVSLDDWEGFVSDERKKFMSSTEYTQWRTSVFERDNYTCQECGRRGGGIYLNCHHILPYRDHPEPEYSLNIDNGITLCEKCHRETYGREYDFMPDYLGKIFDDKAAEIWN